MPFSKVSELLCEHDTRLRRIVDYYVQKAYAELDFSDVEKLAVDEVASKKGHNYITVFSNPDDGSVLFATPGKGSSTFDSFCKEAEHHNLNAQEQINEVSMDMSLAFQKGATDNLPNASITFDKFHVVKLINEALDKVRRGEQSQDKEAKEALKGNRYVFLKNRKNLTKKQLARLEKLENSHYQTAEAYRLKVKFQEVYEHCKDEETAKVALEEWIAEALNSNLEPINKFIVTLRNNMAGILRYFSSKLTNGIAESINTVIGQIRRAARGFRNIKHFINLIYLRKSKLNLPYFITT